MDYSAPMRLVLAVSYLLVGWAGWTSAGVAHADVAWGSRGPLVGHVDAESAEIWFQPAPTTPRPLVVAWWPAGEHGTALQLPLLRRPGAGRSLRAHLPGLRASQTYICQVRAAGESSPRWTARFRTAPPDGHAGRWRFAVASCMKPHWDPSGWRRLLQGEPHRLLLLGDNVYADTTNRSRIWEEHMKMRAIEPFAKAIRSTSTLATWDDHDYAGNDTDGTAPGKAESLLAFREVWANPSAGLPGVPGTFFRFRYGDVDFFVLDVRYYRSPNRQGDGRYKHMLGPAQERWLIDGLATSKAKFKVIASGTTLDDGGEDSWRSFHTARRRLLDAIARLRVEGVVWLSGDLHRSFVRVHPAQATRFYDLYEVVSSGIANSKELTFAYLDFDTDRPDPQIEVRIVDGAGRTVSVTPILLSQLRMR